MKKTYIQPNVKAKTIRFEGMIAGSELSNGGGTGANNITEADAKEDLGGDFGW